MKTGNAWLDELIEHLKEVGLLPMAGGADQPIAYDGEPGLFLNNDPVAKNRPGTIVRIKGKEYMYVQNISATANLVGAPAYVISQTGTYSVSPVYSESQSAEINSVVGVYGNVITTNYYGWIQTKGDFVGLIDTAGASAGDAMIGAATANTTGKITAGSAITNKLIGFSYTNQANGKVNAFLCCEG